MKSSKGIAKLLERKSSIESTMIQNEFFSERLTYAYKEIIKLYNQIILKRKLIYFIGYYSQKYYREWDNITTITDIQKYKKFEHINAKSMNEKYVSMIIDLRTHTDIVSNAITYIFDTDNSLFNFISYSFLPSLYNLFTVIDDCTQFIALLDKIYHANPKYAYQAAKCAFISPSFIHFIEKVIETINIDISMIKNDEDAKSFWQQFIESWKDKIDQIGYLQLKILSKPDDQKFLVESFLKPAMHWPSLFGLNNLYEFMPQSIEKIMLDAIDSCQVVEYLYGIIREEMKQVDESENEEFSVVENENSFIGELTKNYSRPILFTDNDIKFLEFMSSFKNSNETSMPLPTLNDGFKLYYLKPSGVSKDVSKPNLLTSFVGLPYISEAVDDSEEFFNGWGDILKNYSLPFSPSFNNFKNRLIVDLLEARKFQDIVQKNEIEKPSKLSRYLDSLSKLKDVLAYEKEICASRKDLLTSIYTSIYFELQSSASKELPDEIYTSHAQWNFYVDQVAEKFFEWQKNNKSIYANDENGNKKDQAVSINIPYRILLLNLLKNVSFEKFTQNFSWMTSADEEIFKQPKFHSDNVTKFIDDSPQLFGTLINSLRAAYESPSITTTYRMIVRIRSAFEQILKNKFHTIGADQIVPAYCHFCTISSPKNYVSRTLFLYFFMRFKIPGTEQKQAFKMFEQTILNYLISVHHYLQDTKYESSYAEFDNLINSV